MFVPFAHLPEFLEEADVEGSAWVEARMEAFDNIAHLAYDRHVRNEDISGGFDHAAAVHLA